MQKHEIEKELNKHGDFIQIDDLIKLLKEDLPLAIKKFCYSRLIEIYDRKNMFVNSAKIYDVLSIISIAFSEKINYNIREAESYIKFGNFDSADKAVKKAFNHASSSEKQEIYLTIKIFYKKIAENYELSMKRNHAVKIYERLLEMNINEIERKEIKEKLLNLYEKLGKFRELNKLEK